MSDGGRRINSRRPASQKACMLGFCSFYRKSIVFPIKCECHLLPKDIISFFSYIFCTRSHIQAILVPTNDANRSSFRSRIAKILLRALTLVVSKDYLPFDKAQMRMADRRPERSGASFGARLILAASKKGGPICQLRFPFQLHDMLRDATKNGFDDVVSWLPCRTAFNVFDQHLFEEFIMPVYFKMSNYNSFLRQLNLYQFQRLQPGTRGNLLLVPSLLEAHLLITISFL
jgi:hypothetical protein